MAIDIELLGIIVIKGVIMKKINTSDAIKVFGGNPAILYPIVGCVVVTGMDFASNDHMSYGDMGQSCMKGAIHGANLGLGITIPIRNPYVRYAAGMAYGRYAPGLVDNFAKNSRAVAFRTGNNSSFLGGSYD